MKKTAFGLLAAAFLSLVCFAEEPRLQDNVPDTYTVVKGDTLWDISNHFLKNPWLWPEIWQVNTQIVNPHLIYPGDRIRLIYLDGQPRLTLAESPVRDAMRLQPQAQVIATETAIDTLPLEKISSFLSRSRIVGKRDLDKAPYVVSGREEHLLAGADDIVYIRGQVDDLGTVYGVYRKGTAYVDPYTHEFLGLQAIDIGSGSISAKEGDIATMDVERTTQEIRLGDRLLREEERSVDTTFFPSAPASKVDGVILAVEGGVSQVGKLDVVVLNRGEREGLVAGNVMAIYKRGASVRDRVVGGNVKLPDERAGLLMIFRTFEKVSLAIVLDAKKGIAVKDIVKNP